MRAANSFADILVTHREIGPGFDALRVMLSLSVMLVHSFPLAAGLNTYDYRDHWLRYPVFAILPMFFGLSGFLVTASAARVKKSGKFFLQRIFRLIPALSVEVFLSAILLGSMITILPLGDYFSSYHFWAYFGNIIGNVHFELPGVFESNPFPRTVNGNMWTLKPEYYCYLLLLGAMIFGIFGRRNLYLAVLVAAMVGLLVADFGWGLGTTEYAYSTAGLVFSFLAGSLFFCIAGKISYHWFLFALSVIGYVIFLSLDGFSLLAVLCLIYSTIFIGCTKIPVPYPFNLGDYSYGIYLYGFPVQQTLVFYFSITHHWYILFATSVPLTVLFAMLSWHKIEKPTLRLRNKLTERSHSY